MAALAVMGTVLTLGWSGPWGGSKLPDPGLGLAERAAEILAESIRFHTVSPPGDEAPLAEFYVAILRREGIEARRIETPSQESQAGRAAAWARVPGTGTRRAVVLLSHLDVVPAEPTEWAVDPFAGVVGGGYVVGRGALDAKGVAVVHLLTLIELARRPVPLERDVIFLATPDEETGGRHGSMFLVRSRPDLLRNAEYLLTEGGGVLSGNGSLPPIWGVSVAEKSACWMELVARGTPGHSSVPPRDAAVARLLDALMRVRRLDSQIRVVPEVARMFAALASVSTPKDRAGFADLSTSLATDPLFRARFLADPGRAALVRNTLAVSVLQGSRRTNILPATARAHLDARLLPGERCSAMVDRVRAAIADPAVTVEPILAFSSGSSPVDTDLFRAIVQVAAEVDPAAAVVPRVSAGFTDAHFYRQRGIVSYGFVPRWLSPTESRSIHGPNERISIDNLERGVRTLVRILENLDH